MKYLLLLLFIPVTNTYVNRHSNIQDCEKLLFSGEFCNSEENDEKWKLVYLGKEEKGFEFYCINQPAWRYILGYYDRDESNETVTLCSNSDCDIEIVFSNCASEQTCPKYTGHLIEFSVKEDGDEKLHGLACCSEN